MESVSREGNVRSLVMAGGICLILVGVVAVALLPLFIISPSQPADTGAFLKQIAQNLALNYAIDSLQVAKQFLLIPAALGLYFILKKANQSAMLLATGLWAGFIFLVLPLQAVPQLTLLGLATNYAATMSPAQQLADVTSAITMLQLFTVGNILGDLFLAGALLTTGLTMYGAPSFGRVLGTVGVLAAFASQLDKVPVLATSPAAEIPFFILATIWFVWGGYRVYTVGHRLETPVALRIDSQRAT